MVKINVTLRTTWKMGVCNKQWCQKIIAEAMNLRRSIVYNERQENVLCSSCTEGCSKHTFMIAIRLLIWKNIMDKERTLKKLQDSVAWIRKPFHHPAASATRITTWQATWRPNNIQHFLIDPYFFSSLKQLCNSSPLKKIAAKSSTNIKRRVGTVKDMTR